MSRSTNTSELTALKARVQRYFRAHGRHHLPWRKTKDPYRILVSEVMLQQTQVDRVIPYYEAFLKRFPDVHALAQAPGKDVLATWSGLGYNRRAKFLREAARMVVEKYGGDVPHTYSELVALPGIGEYTAKAVRVFAFDEPEVLIETNIRSVLLHELFADTEGVSDAELVPILEQLLSRIRSPRQWYWALMDYGAHLKRTHGNASRRSAHHSKQSAFEGSIRQVRGAIMRELLRAPRSSEELAAAVPHPKERLDSALASLARDGLIQKKRTRWSIV